MIRISWKKCEMWKRLDWDDQSNHFDYFDRSDFFYIILSIRLILIVTKPMSKSNCMSLIKLKRKKNYIKNYSKHNYHSPNTAETTFYCFDTKNSHIYLRQMEWNGERTPSECFPGNPISSLRHYRDKTDARCEEQSMPNLQHTHTVQYGAANVSILMPLQGR